MVSENTTILIMAAGTGGHVFPALSIAQSLREKGVLVEWLGTRYGMENKLLVNSGIKIHPISIKGLKGKGVLRLIVAPFMLVVALLQSMRIIFRVNPNCVLGMGGFVSGPGGLAAKIMGKRLLIHEQNAVPGFTNRMLAKISDRVFEAFPNTFSPSPKVISTGNPIREEIAALNGLSRDYSKSDQPLRILVLGGSQGALAINRAVPALVQSLSMSGSGAPFVLHQTGSSTLVETLELYRSLGIGLSEQIRVEAFIEDMSAAYTWADLVICRSGASTVSELAAAGLPSILVPYPHHSDRQQTHNAQWLVDAGAAHLIEQSELSPQSLMEILSDWQENRGKLQDMSMRAKSIGICNANTVIAAQCLEVAHG